MGIQANDTRYETYVAYRAELVRYATPILGSREDAEDVVQEAFVRFVPEAAQSPSRLKSYLYRIVRNLAFDARRRRRLESRGQNDVAGRDGHRHPGDDRDQCNNTGRN